jgi:hypothetical protein
VRPFATRFLLALLGASLMLACSDGTSPTPTDAMRPPAMRPAYKVGGRSGFGFNGSVSGFPTGEVRLTGGGSFDPATANNTVPTPTSVASAGGFDCTLAIAQGQGPLGGCGDDEGVRWDTVQLLKSNTFKCTASEVARPATTDDHTVVLLADFYRAGDGNEESFTAQMIVTDERDLDDDIPGIQNLWVQGVGCGTAIVNFN